MSNSNQWILFAGGILLGGTAAFFGALWLLDKAIISAINRHK